MPFMIYFVLLLTVFYKCNLCSGFVDETLSWGFWKLFSTGTYAIIGTTCVEFENVMKSTMKKKSF